MKERKATNLNINLKKYREKTKKIIINLKKDYKKKKQKSGVVQPGKGRVARLGP
jgi:hypothetical protein